MAKNTSKAPWGQGWQQNHIMLSQYCRKPHQRCMFTNGRDDIPEDTTVTGGVVVIAVEIET